MNISGLNSPDIYSMSRQYLSMSLSRELWPCDLRGSSSFKEQESFEFPCLSSSVLNVKMNKGHLLFMWLLFSKLSEAISQYTDWTTQYSLPISMSKTIIFKRDCKIAITIQNCVNLLNLKFLITKWAGSETNNYTFIPLTKIHTLLHDKCTK